MNFLKTFLWTIRETHKMEKFSNVDELVNILKPVKPVYCIRPSSIKTSINFFKKKFPGKILYAVKTNPHEIVLKHVINIKFYIYTLIKL